MCYWQRAERPIPPADTTGTARESGERRSACAQVTIVIPAYNAASTIAETMDSILLQSVPAAEIVVVDDGSTDQTAEIVARYPPPVALIRQRNQGLAAARNTGCLAATGELIAFIDADDVAMPQRLELQLACFEADPSVLLVSSDFSAFNGAGKVSDTYHSSYYPAMWDPQIGQSLLGEPRSFWATSQSSENAAKVRYYVGHHYSNLVHDMYIHPPTIMFRRELFDLAGPFDASLRNLCDWEWLIRASKYGPFAFLSLPLIAYRLHQGQMSRRASETHTDSIVITQRVMKRDPEIARKDVVRFKQDLGDYQLGAAEAARRSSKLAAIEYILRSIPNRGIDRRTLAALLRTTLPSSVVAKLHALIHA